MIRGFRQIVPRLPLGLKGVKAGITMENETCYTFFFNHVNLKMCRRDGSECCSRKGKERYHTYPGGNLYLIHPQIMSVIEKDTNNIKVLNKELQERPVNFKKLQFRYVTLVIEQLADNRKVIYNLN